MIERITLPPWAETLREKYLAGIASQFLLHSNINDFVPYQNRFLPLREFLSFLLGKKDLLLFYNRSEGITFGSPEMKEKFKRIVDVAMGPFSISPQISQGLPREPGKVLPLLEAIMTLQPTAIVIDFVETIVPSGELSYMGGEDRSNLVTLKRWASNPQLLKADSVVILLTENLTDVHQSLRNSTSRMEIIEIPFPDQKERHEYISFLVSQKGPSLEMTSRELANITAGLTRVHLSEIFRQAENQGVPVTFELVRKRKKEIIENECANLVEFVEPKYGMEVVGGLDAIKEALLKIAAAIREGRRRWIPMGILFTGPPGTGKTFLGECFARESGLNCLKMKNFREKWVGSTEANLEKILNVIKGMSPVVVIVDEIDQSIGGREEEGDSGTSNRIFAMLISFMGDTSHRGEIIFLGMGNRPDLLDEAMKRPGRFDLKIPFFFPQTENETLGILSASLKKNGIRCQDGSFERVLKKINGYSGAEIESVVLLGAQIADERGSGAGDQAQAREAGGSGQSQLTIQDLEQAAEEFLPTRNNAMIEYMELLSVQEASLKKMLPEKYQKMSDQEMTGRIKALKIELGL